MKRLASSLQARQLTAAAEEGNMALMREMRDTLGRKNVGQVIPECLDGKVTHGSILERFRNAMRNCITLLVQSKQWLLLRKAYKIKS